MICTKKRPNIQQEYVLSTSSSTTTQKSKDNKTPGMEEDSNKRAATDSETEGKPSAKKCREHRCLNNYLHSGTYQKSKGETHE